LVCRNAARPIAFLLCMAVSAAALADQTQDDKPGEKRDDRFLRLARDTDGSPIALEVSIVRYSPPDCGQAGPTVDLIAAVHVAEKSYYQELNRLFESYDAVLYELVAPEGTRVPEGGPERAGNAVSMLQTAMTAILDLEFQLRAIDYTRENLIHADMSPEQFAQSMRRRGESMFEVFFRMMRHAMKRESQQPAGAGDVRLLLALFDENRAVALKRVLAEQLQDLEGSLNAINGPDGSTLITERNKVALEVLREQISAGKQNLAIFYGAGHMWDFDERLREDFGLVPASTRWLVAWELTVESPSDEALP